MSRDAYAAGIKAHALLLLCAAAVATAKANLASMSVDEFAAHYVTKRLHEREELLAELSGSFDAKYWQPPAGPPPESVDWRGKGVLGPVRTQHAPHETGCGACWAFAAVALAESSSALDTGKAVSFSEQQLIDCDRKKYGGFDHGCDGGYAWKALNYAINNGGLTSEENYPFVGHRTKCDFEKEKEVVGTVTSWSHVKPLDEDTLKRAVAARPVLVNVCCGSVLPAPLNATVLAEWKNYTGDGVLSFPCCEGQLHRHKAYDHSVLLVGYGKLNGVKHWIIKNSWSEEWGEKGYGYLLRGGSRYQQCGLASGPIVAFRAPQALAVQ